MLEGCLPALSLFQLLIFVFVLLLNSYYRHCEEAFSADAAIYPAFVMTFVFILFLKKIASARSYLASQ